jgi:hypothetical protein
LLPRLGKAIHSVAALGASFVGANLAGALQLAASHAVPHIKQDLRGLTKPVPATSRFYRGSGPSCALSGLGQDWRCIVSRVVIVRPLQCALPRRHRGGWPFLEAGTSVVTGASGSVPSGTAVSAGASPAVPADTNAIAALAPSATRPSPNAVARGASASPSWPVRQT